MSQRYDLIVVGGGPGGYIAAIRAAQLGFETALVEREQLGGVCLNWGCIPTKALLKGAEIAHTLTAMGNFGFSADNIQFDLSKLVAHSRNVAGRLTSGIDFLMKKNGISVISGTAVVSDKCQLTVTNDGNNKSIYQADHIILATGARARALPGIEFDGEYIWGAREAMTPVELPGRLLVIGSGAIGVEFSSLYSDLGSDVMVVEILDRILPAEDAEISAAAQQAFLKRGITIHTSTGVESLQIDNGEVAVTLKDRQGQLIPCVFDRVIVAAGIAGNIENLGLEELGVNTERGFIVTDDYCRTNLVGLYAIGDVAGPPCLAHKASHEGVLCVEKIAGLETHPLKPEQVPGCTYSRPQIASVGLTESQAKDRGHALRVGRFHYGANGKALAIGDSDGFVKTVFDADSGELLGAHMIGPDVTEQIQGYGIGRTLETTETELMASVFPHPTLSEAMHEAVLDAYGRALHQ